jgi:enoyl-[acyl-carrier-protein] reductase (NADH)
VAGEPDKPSDPQHRQPVRVGELRGHQTTHLGAQHIGNRRQLGKATVQLGAVFLASDAAKMINGADLLVDCGYTIR